MKLPQLIEDFIKASNESDQSAFVKCFTENAIHHDEGETHTGRREIGEWFIQSKSKYQQQMKPMSLSENGNEITLKANVSGNFKGSPILFTYKMKTQDGLIADMSIGT